MVELEQDASEDFLRSMTHVGSGGGGGGTGRGQGASLVKQLGHTHDTTTTNTASDKILRQIKRHYNLYLAL